MTGPNVLLRAPEPADIDILYRWENDMRIWHLSNTITPFSKFAIEQYVLNAQDDIFSSKQLRLMIECHTAGSESGVVGSIDLFDFDPFHRRAGIGILLDESSRRKGFASEAIGLLTEYCFKTLNLHQLYCNIEQSNTESIHVFTKAGFTACGNKQEWLFRNGQWMDELIFQKINNT